MHERTDVETMTAGLTVGVTRTAQDNGMAKLTSAIADALPANLRLYDDDATQLLDWLGAARLNRVGCFKYEPVEGAPANAIDGVVPDEVKEERWHRFMAAQQEISRSLLAERVGREIDVIVDEVDEEGAMARSVWDAPEIDGSVFLNGCSDVKAGEIVRARVLHADEYDLWGELVRKG